MDPSDPTTPNKKIFFRRVLKPKKDIPYALPGEEALPEGYEYITYLEFIPGEGQEFEYVPFVDTSFVPDESTVLPEEPESLEPTQRVKRYVKIIKSLIKVKKFGVASTIGNLTYSSVFSPLFSEKNVSINSPNGWKSLKN